MPGMGKGWSINVGELKKAIADIPDDYEVMLENAEVNGCDISDVNINIIIPPALDSVGLVILGGGQILNDEYYYHERLDAHYRVGGSKYWDSRKQEWITN